MPRVRYLTRQGGRWWYRRGVPATLQEVMGTKEVWEPLGADRAEAVNRIPLINASVEKRLQMARQSLGDPDAVDAIPEAELTRIAHAVFRDHLNRFEALRRPNLDEPPESQEVVLEVSANHDDWEEGLHHRDWSQQTQTVTLGLLEAHGWFITPVHPSFPVAREYVARAILAAWRTCLDRIRGEFAPRTIDSVVKSVRNLPDVTVSQLIDRYSGAPEHERWSVKTRNGYIIIFRVLKELLGEDKPVRQLTREDFRRVQDVILGLPPNYTKQVAYKGLSVVEAVEKRAALGKPAVTKTTANSYLINLAAIFGWAEREGFVDANLARGLAAGLVRKQDKKTRKSAFDLSQLKAIFDAPLYRGCVNDEAGYATPGPDVSRRGRFWVPLLSLFTGMRLNECCQLDVSDVAELDGTTCVLIHEDPEGGDDADRKRVKTEAGQRYVPVHPELVRIGFMNYVKTMRDSGAKRLFPELPVGKNGYYSDPFSKWFGRFLDKAKAAKAKTSFHSFRHSYRDALREANISIERVRALGGWTGNGGAEEIYGDGLRPRTLAKEIKKVRYPGLDLSHLHVTATKEA